MDAVEFLTNVNRICAAHGSADGCPDGCPLRFFCNKGYDSQTKETIDAAVKAVEDWVEDHPIMTRLSEYKKMFPDCRLWKTGYPVADPCTISSYYDDKKCDEMIDCDRCRREFWDEVLG